MEFTAKRTKLNELHAKLAALTKLKESNWADFTLNEKMIIFPVVQEKIDQVSSELSHYYEEDFASDLYDEIEKDFAANPNFTYEKLTQRSFARHVPIYFKLSLEEQDELEDAVRNLVYRVK